MIAMTMTKVRNEYGKIISIEQAVEKITDGCSLMVGGFGGVGSPPSLLQAIFDKGVQQLTLICNDTAFPHIGVGPLVSQGRVKKSDRVPYRIQSDCRQAITRRNARGGILPARCSC